MALERFMTTLEVAEHLRQPESTVRYWRTVGYGPESVKIGHRRLYRESDVAAWVEAQRKVQNGRAAAQ